MKRDIYNETTARIVAEMEKGILPWVKPWSTDGRTAPAVSMPISASTGRRYSGVNVLLLWGAQQACGYQSKRWTTYKQAAAMGGQVKKGEKGTMIFFADKFVPAAEKARAAENGDTAKAISFLKSFWVFNVSQCDGLPSWPDDIAPPAAPEFVIPAAEQVIKGTGADFRIGGDSAYYVPSADYIQVPPMPAFHDQINFYRTAFHELGHWTGAQHRLARTFGARHGDTAYAREELVAELTAAFCCASLGIAPTVRHADYLGSWLTVLREDSRAIFRAASLASKAADYIQGAQAVALPDPEAIAA